VLGCLAEPAHQRLLEPSRGAVHGDEGVVVDVPDRDEPAAAQPGVELACNSVVCLDFVFPDEADADLRKPGRRPPDGDAHAGFRIRPQHVGHVDVVSEDFDTHDLLLWVE
jgi:hypothetical protein